MHVTVQLFAGLRERAGRSEIALADLPDELDVAGLKRELAARFPALRSLAGVRGVVGASYVPDATPLSDGARVALLPPVSGGASELAADLERGVFELARAPLDPLAAQARVAHPACGAGVVFTGSTREVNRGRRVLRLEYEAFEAMAGPEMARIFERCRARHGEAGMRMVCQHRVGVVAVGEPSVVIAVASPHRERAFAACRFLIDELKASLPVWKKEIYEGGEHWIGERS